MILVREILYVLFYITHPAIAQTFVYGESLRTTLIGMVFPDPEGGFAAWAARNGFKGMDFDTLCANEQVVAKLRQSVVNYN